MKNLIDVMFEDIELAELKGSEKGIEEAERYRSNFAKAITEGTMKEDLKRMVDDNEFVQLLKPDEFKTLLRNIQKEIRFFAENESAAFWRGGDHRSDIDTISGIRTEIEELIVRKKQFEEWKKQDEAARIAKKLEKAKEGAHDESLMAPEKLTTSTVAAVTMIEECARVSSDKDEQLIKALKSLRCRWDRPYWIKDTVPGLTTKEDAAAELVNGLLNKGFQVICEDEEVRRKALESDYTPTPSRVILYDKKTGRLQIKWRGQNDDLYHAARDIKGSKWEDHCVTVSAKRYLEVEGFAEVHGFTIAPKAQEVMAVEREKVLNAQVKAAPHKKAESKELDLEAILERPAEVMSKHMLID